MNGQRIALEGLSGEVSIDNVELGVSSDKNYAVHFTKDNIGIQEKIAVLNISDGLHTIFTTEKLNERKYTTVEAENSGKGFYLTANGGVFTEISCLTNNFKIKIKPGNNIGDELIFKTDGGTSTIIIADKTFTISGDKEFTFTF